MQNNTAWLFHPLEENPVTEPGPSDFILRALYEFAKDSSEWLWLNAFDTSNFQGNIQRFRDYDKSIAELLKSNRIRYDKKTNSLVLSRQTYNQIKESVATYGDYPPPEDRQVRKPRVYFTVYGSGPAVRSDTESYGFVQDEIEDSQFGHRSRVFQDCLGLQRNTLAVDMESFAFYESASQVEPPLDFVVIKTVTDHADHKKGDLNHEYAKQLSAGYALEVIKLYLQDNNVRGHTLGSKQDTTTEGFEDQNVLGEIRDQARGRAKTVSAWFHLLCSSINSQLENEDPGTTRELLTVIKPSLARFFAVVGVIGDQRDRDALSSLQMGFEFLQEKIWTNSGDQQERLRLTGYVLFTYTVATLLEHSAFEILEEYLDRRYQITNLRGKLFEVDYVEFSRPFTTFQPTSDKGLKELFSTAEFSPAKFFEAFLQADILLSVRSRILEMRLWTPHCCKYLNEDSAKLIRGACINPRTTRLGTILGTKQAETLSEGIRNTFVELSKTNEAARRFYINFLK